jgi:cytoskeletal protein CcmA (bactofilin family)
MWGNKQEQRNTANLSPAPGLGHPADASRPASGNVHNTAWLGPTVSVKGQISGNEDLHIEGKVEGPISLGGHRLTVGRNAEVTADVVVGDIVVHGKINGNIRASKRLEIKRDGSVTGELITASIVIEDGAHFRGKIEIHNSSKQVGTDFDSVLARASKPE